VQAWLVDMRAAPRREKAEQRREALVERYQREFPELCRCLLDDTDARLTHLEVPQRHQQYGRTANLVARACVEERRRTKVLPPLWTDGSLVHVVFGVLIRVSERWGKKCCSEFEQQQIRSLRARLKLDEQEVSTNEVSVHVPTRRSAASAA
jgi:transposase-like protein